MPVPDHLREQYLERPLPSSDESERIVLGTILIDNALAGPALEKLSPEDFYSPLNKRVFAAMRVLFTAFRPIDPILIGEELKKEGSLDAVGGVATVTNLSHGIPHFPNIDEYIRTIADKARARKLIRACNTITQEALAEEDHINIVLDRAEQAIFDISNQKNTTDAQLLHPAVIDLLSEKSEQIKARMKVSGLTTGLKDLDDQIGGWQKPDLIVVAGRPSMGKTSLVTKAAVDGLLATPGAVGIFFSAEMALKQIVGRILCQNASTNLWAFNHNVLRDFEWNRVVDAAAPFQGLNFYIDDSPSISVMQMMAKSRRIQAKHKRLDLVIVDHLGLMTSSRQKDTRVNQLTQITGDLKALAKTLDVPVIALSQLSRGVENRNPPVPVMADLRDSGSIEQDADVVLLLYRPEYYEQDEAKKRELAGKAKIIIAKQRNGPVDSIDVAWVKASARFEDAVKGQ